MRSAETVADCITVYFADASRMGRKKRWTYSMNATSTPKVRLPATISTPPHQRRAATATAPTSSTPA